MAESDTAICNLALGKLGATRITSLAQDSPEARTCNAVYAMIRDQEIRRNRWTFAKTRAELTPHATAPPINTGFLYAFPLPSDYLRSLAPNESNFKNGRNDVDWRLELHEGVRAILTNDGTTIHLPYIRRVTDPTLFDPLFDDAFACQLAWQMCEEITQSNTKKEAVRKEYNTAIKDAKKINAIETQPDEAPEDTWLSARR